MFFNSGEACSVLIEQYIGNALVSRAQMTEPKEFLMMSFIALCEGASRQPQPIKLRMLRYEEEWNQLEQQVKQLEFSIEFRNNRFGG